MSGLPGTEYPMRSQIHRATVFVLYQLSLLTGIVMFPMAVVMRKVGVELPLGRLIDKVGTAYERTSGNTA